MVKEATKLHIPPTLCVGYQKREGTYTGRLAFVIYRDAGGTLHQEKSWDAWRDKGLAPREFANEPTEGFVLNKSVGGQRESWGRNARNEYIRVYDPRDFEFEISVPNLGFILGQVGCSPGKGLEGKFVYGWSGPKPVLLPCSSLEYRSSVEFTGLKGKNVPKRDLVVGHTYQTKQLGQWVYLGLHDYYYMPQRIGWRSKPNDPGSCRQHVFADISAGAGQLVYENTTGKLAAVASTEPPDNLGRLIELHTRSFRGSKVRELFLKPKEHAPASHVYWALEAKPGLFVEMCTEHRPGKVPALSPSGRAYKVVGGILHEVDAPRVGIGEVGPEHVLCARLECGTEFEVRDTWNLHKGFDWARVQAEDSEQEDTEKNDE